MLRQSQQKAQQLAQQLRDDDRCLTFDTRAGAAYGRPGAR